MCTCSDVRIPSQKALHERMFSCVGVFVYSEIHVLCILCMCTCSDVRIQAVSVDNKLKTDINPSQAAGLEWCVGALSNVDLGHLAVPGK